MRSENSTWNEMFYLPIFKELEHSTNLKNIQKKLSISKQKLNYYLRQMVKKGIIIHKGRGWYEVVKSSKNSTKYGFLLKKDFIRGHAYIWSIELGKIPKSWSKRIEILKKNNTHYKLVGAKRTTPRIKVMGRKVWLGNTHLRVFDKKNASYYGETAIKSRYKAFEQIKLIVGAINSKLGLFLKPSNIQFRREHYALIKNDLAIEENRKGNIWRIRDEDGEWLLIDDSLGKGGELENIGKKAFKTNIPMQRWWNDNKKYNFKVTPSFIMESLSGLVKTQVMNANNIIKHQKVLDEMLITLKKIQESLEKS